MKKIAYANAVADDKVRRFVPPVRVVRESAGVSDSAALLDGVHTQSFVHFNPRECVLPPGGEIILDFGLELHGLLTVTTGCMKLSRARITFGESVSETLGTPTQDHAIHQELLSLPQLGQVNFGQTAFRFVRLEIPADAPEVRLIGVVATAIYRDWEYRGTFLSDDERLNRIWEVGAYTVHLNCQDYIYDGVKRDRLVWMGDLYPEIRTILAAFDETALVEKSLDFVRDHTPDDKWMNTASSYSCWWVICQRDFYLYRGNYAYLREQKSEGIEMMLAVDISNSMLAEDFEPNRLERTKYAIGKLFERLQQDRVGLVVFAGEPKVQLPITSDYRMARAFARRIDPSLVSVQGTAIGKALEQALLAFSGDTEQSHGRVIILITDGENHDDDAIAVAERAAQMGVKIFTIGIGTPEGAPIQIGGEFIKDEAGEMVVSKLNEEMLARIADITGGAYVRSSKQSIGLDEIVKAINEMEQTELSTVRFEEFNEQYQYLLIAALVLLLLEFVVLDRRNPLLAHLNIFREK